MSKMIPAGISYLVGSTGPGAEGAFEIFERAIELRFGEIHLKHDESTGLKAIIAIHNTNLGPALGGTRCVPYVSSAVALNDAMRLARGMSYKSAFFNLPYGGGKGVLLRPPKIFDRKRYFESYGEFIDALGGRFITAVDSGTHVTDMDLIAHKTRYVVSTSRGLGDPSPYTARGVVLAMAAAVKARLGRDDLEGVRVAIQGVGNVGYRLAEMLHQRGARLTVCDIDPGAAERCAEQFGADRVSNEEIYGVDCDVFSPCALGGVLNDQTIALLRAKIVCGAANNQLLDERRHAEALLRRNVLFAPDYIANAGGLLHAVPGDKAGLEGQIEGIYDALLDVFERARDNGESTLSVADRIAESVLYHPQRREAS